MTPSRRALRPKSDDAGSSRKRPDSRTAHEVRILEPVDAVGSGASAHVAPAYPVAEGARSRTALEDVFIDVEDFVLKRGREVLEREEESSDVEEKVLERAWFVLNVARARRDVE